ncbi:ParB/RepB/Spo0J family partition protein [bacterium]|nr:ParB/RepB/Spo0J family partition protein [bacterium]
MPKKGLPTDMRMRADSHFVDHITSGRSTAVGRMIEADRIDPNPTQPRREMRDLDELVGSIRERGILEPLLVRPLETGRFQIIAGERRFQAAKQVGLTMVPCVELEVDDRGCLEISLVENLQRRDLTPFEEAAAVNRLVEEFSYTHEQIARKLGRSRTSVTEILSLNRMPQTVKDACRRADITAKSTLMEIVRQPDEATMLALVAAVSSESLTRDEVRERKKDAAGAANAVQRLRPFVFRYKPRDRDFSLSLKFDRETVEPTDLIRTLEGIIADLRDDLANGRPLAPEAKGADVEAQV